MMEIQYHFPESCTEICPESFLQCAHARGSDREYLPVPSYEKCGELERALAVTLKQKLRQICKTLHTKDMME